MLNFTIPLVSSSAAGYAIWISLMLLCEGGHFTLVPNALKKIFGPAKSTALYGIMFSFSGVMSIVIALVQTAVLTSNASSYNIMFYLDGAYSAAALLMLLFLFKEEKYPGP